MKKRVLPLPVENLQQFVKVFVQNVNVLRISRQPKVVFAEQNSLVVLLECCWSAVLEYELCKVLLKDKINIV